MVKLLRNEQHTRVKHFNLNVYFVLNVKIYIFRLGFDECTWDAWEPEIKLDNMHCFIVFSRLFRRFVDRKVSFEQQPSLSVYQPQDFFFFWACHTSQSETTMFHKLERLTLPLDVALCESLEIPRSTMNICRFKVSKATEGEGRGGGERAVRILRALFTKQPPLHSNAGEQMES